MNTLAPSLALLTVIVGDVYSMPGWLSWIIVAIIWLTGFLALVRVQFARNYRNADVFTAFWRTTALGFALVAALVMLMFSHGGL